LVAKVTDDASAAVAGATVSWSIESGSGTLTASSTRSDGGGLTRNTIRLGPTPGTTVVTAAVTGGTVSASFQITAITSDSERVTVTSPRIVVIDSGQSTTPAFGAVNASGNPIANPGLSYASSNAAVATVSADGVVQGVAPGEAVIAARAPVIGYVADSV